MEDKFHGIKEQIGVQIPGDSCVTGTQGILKGVWTKRMLGRESRSLEGYLVVITWGLGNFVHLNLSFLSKLSSWMNFSFFSTILVNMLLVSEDGYENHLSFVMITTLVFSDVCVLEWVWIFTRCLREIMHMGKLRHKEAQIFPGHLCLGTVPRLITVWLMSLCRLYTSAS